VGYIRLIFSGSEYLLYRSCLDYWESMAEICSERSILLHYQMKLHWREESVPAMYLSMLRKRIMSDRSASLSKVFSDKDYDPTAFFMTWCEEPQAIRVLKGPKTLREDGETLESMLGSIGSLWVAISDSDTWKKTGRIKVGPVMDHWQW